MSKCINATFGALCAQSNKLLGCSRAQQKEKFNTVIASFLPLFMAFSFDDLEDQANVIYYGFSELYYKSAIEESLIDIVKKYFDMSSSSAIVQEILDRLTKLYDEDMKRVEHNMIRALYIDEVPEKSNN